MGALPPLPIWVVFFNLQNDVLVASTILYVYSGTQLQQTLSEQTQLQQTLLEQTQLQPTLLEQTQL